jgi:hypothetical protein
MGEGMGEGRWSMIARTKCEIELSSAGSRERPVPARASSLHTSPAAAFEEAPVRDPSPGRSCKGAAAPYSGRGAQPISRAAAEGRLVSFSRSRRGLKGGPGFARRAGLPLGNGGI